MADGGTPIPFDEEHGCHHNKLDAAILAHRADPTEANRQRVMEVGEEGMVAFMEHQTLDYMRRTM
jgi:hypothetical protein